MKPNFFVVASALLFAACNKTSNSEIPTPAPLPAISMKIKTQTSGATIRTYTYDAQGRAARVEYSDGSKKEYEYPAGKVIRKYYNSAGIYQSLYTEELNPDGYSIRSTRTDFPTWENLYTYGADKTLAKQIMKSNRILICDYFWSKGNLDSVRLSFENGNWYYTEVRTYHTDKANVLGDAATGEEYWGKNSKDLLKSVVNLFADGSTSTMDTYSYEFDSHGRVTKQTSNRSNGDVYVTLNTYN